MHYNEDPMEFYIVYGTSFSLRTIAHSSSISFVKSGDLCLAHSII